MVWLWLIPTEFQVHLTFSFLYSCSNRGNMTENDFLAIWTFNLHKEVFRPHYVFKNHQQAVPTKVKWKMHTLFRDHQQITFITLKRFCQLHNSHLPLPLLLTDNSNQNPKKDICPFHIVFQVLNILLIKIFKMQLPDLSDTTQIFLF